MSVLEQDHYKYDEYSVMDTVIMGNRKLYDIMKEKEALYAKPDFSDADGERAAELEGEFAEMNGWDAETEADQLLNGLGIPMELHYAPMSSLDGRQKVKVLLAQALFGQPTIILLDEPTNGLDIDAIDWLENFLIDYPYTIIMRLSIQRTFSPPLSTLAGLYTSSPENSIRPRKPRRKVSAGSSLYWRSQSIRLPSKPSKKAELSCGK